MAPSHPPARAVVNTHTRIPADIHTEIAWLSPALLSDRNGKHLLWKHYVNIEPKS